MCPPNGLQEVNGALQHEAELVMPHLDSKPKSRCWVEGGCEKVLSRRVNAVSSCELTHTERPIDRLSLCLPAVTTSIWKSTTSPTGWQNPPPMVSSTAAPNTLPSPTTATPTWVGRENSCCGCAAPRVSNPLSKLPAVVQQRWSRPNPRGSCAAAARRPSRE